MALGFTWQQLIERVQIHINNDFPSSDTSLSDNQALLYINEAMSFGLVGQVWQGAKVMGFMEMPEAYIVQFALSVPTQDTVSGYWYTTLPQPPLSLPLGYSINRVYPATTGFGQGKDCIAIKANRVGRRKTMPMQFGVRYWVTAQKLWLAASDGSSLLNQVFYVEMPSTRAVNLSDAMNLPDDATKLIFDLVVARLKDRLGLPQDVILDDLPSGNKSS